MCAVGWCDRGAGGVEREKKKKEAEIKVSIMPVKQTPIVCQPALVHSGEQRPSGMKVGRRLLFSF